MEKISKKRECVEYYDVFVAADGTEFENADECKKYEQSALGVLNIKYKKLIVKESTEDGILDIGSCDNSVEVLKPVTQADADLIMQMYILINPHVKESCYADCVPYAQNIVQRAINENDYVIVGRGYNNDEFWFYGTCNSLKEHIDKFAQPEEKNDENA